MFTDPDLHSNFWSVQWGRLDQAVTTMISRNLIANADPKSVSIPNSVDEAVMALAEIGVREIMRDMHTGRVPWTVGSFSDIGEFVDQNEYALLTRPEMAFDESIDDILPPGSDSRTQTFYDVCNAVQAQMQHWLDETILLRQFIADSLIKSNNMPQIQTCQYVPVTTIVPKKWSGWFYGALSEGAPFSWGDNNRTMVSPERFIKHVEDVVIVGENWVSAQDRDEFFATIKSLGDDVYIDLEN